MGAAVDTAVRPRPRKGRGFFLALIIGSGVVILALALLFFMGKRFFIFTWQKFVIEKAVVRALPPEYTLEEAERVRMALLAFYDAGARREVSDEALYGLSQGIKEILADGRITKAEAEAMMVFVAEHGPKAPAGPGR
jgi:hypothetical protein